MKKNKTTKISTLGSQITSIISVALVLLVLGVLASMWIAADRITNSLLGDVEIIVKMDLNASDNDIAQVKSYLQKRPYTASLGYASAQDVLAQEMEYNSEILDLIGENPYSAEFNVKLKPAYVHPDSITLISNQIMLLGQVDNVISQAEMVRSVRAASTRLSLILSVVALVLLIISIVLIYNTISIAVYARRFVIRTMQLVGATGAFIRKPFVRAGIASGVIAAIIASGVLWATYFYITSYGTEIAYAMPMSLLAAVCAALLAIGIAICGISSLLATNRYLRATNDALYS